MGIFAQRGCGIAHSIAKSGLLSLASCPSPMKVRDSIQYEELRRTAIQPYE
jgi:hypothetical protein